MKKQVCIIGAGVIGLSVATHLLESYCEEVVVTVIADKFTPDTVASDKSGALILVSKSSVLSNDKRKLEEWMRKSQNHFKRLYNSPESDVSGVSYTSGSNILPPGQSGPAWYKDFVPSYQDVTCSSEEPFTGRDLARCCCYTVDPRKYMPYLTGKIQKLGGVLVKKRVHDLSTLNSFDIIINCSGLGARELANDSNVYPTKGILVSVEAPSIKEWLLEGVVYSSRRTFIFPHHDNLVLGGYNEQNTEDCLIDPIETQGIIDRCSKVEPSIAKATVLDVWAGVRPMRRGGVRLETDDSSLPDGSLVVHNYGHASYGFTLSWGCAEEVGDIVGRTLGLHRKQLSLPVSKL